MDHRTIRVLLVDDEEDFLGVLDRRLRWRGLEVTRARTGAEALDALAEFPADVVVLDLKMPGMDGLETLRRLGGHGLLGEVPVVIITGLDVDECRRSASAAGARDYVLKENDPGRIGSEMVSAVERWLARREAKQAGAKSA